MKSISFYDEPKTYDRYHPLLYHLKDVGWSIFLSLTWNVESRRRATHDAETLRRVDFNQLMFKTCGVLKTRRRNFYVYHCMEWGKAGECHFHGLLSNRRPDIVSDSIFAGTMERIWTKEFKRFASFGDVRYGAGTAKVVPYNQAKEWPAVNYCLKREFDINGCHRERFDAMSKNLINYLRSRFTA